MGGSEVMAAVLAAIGGSIAGWVASGLAVVHRVSAIEKALTRIETRLDKFVGEP